MIELILIANAGSGTISTLELHRGDAPRLDVLATTPDLKGCSTFVVDAERSLVYAATKEPSIVTLRLDRETGKLEELARREVESQLVYLDLSEDGDVLLGASYHDGFGAAWPVTDGELGEPHSRFEHANVHAIVVAGDNVYAPALGDDLTAQFRLADGELTPLTPPKVDAPAGSGPRHIVVDGDDAYLLTEFSGEVIHYRRGDNGALIEEERKVVVDPEAGLSRSRYGADPKEEHLIWGADLHRAGRFLFTSERTTSTIAAVEVGADGGLGEVLGHTSVEQQPRGFAVTPDGEFLISVGERSTFAALFAIGDDGALDQVSRVQIGEGANWVRVI